MPDPEASDCPAHTQVVTTSHPESAQKLEEEEEEEHQGSVTTES